MRYMILVLLAGCATDFQAEKYEPACARQCLQVHADCAVRRPAGFAGVCDDNARQCFRTCPEK